VKETKILDVWEEHPEVFHYTTQAGLQGILESQALRATHYKYLNDQTELNAVAPKLRVGIRPHVLKFAQQLSIRNQKFRREVVDQGRLNSFVDSEVATMINALQRVTLGEDGRRKFFEPYICSFCSHKLLYEISNGLLSQWRAYGGGGGYALVFDTKRLTEVFQSETDRYHFSSGFFGDVVYDGDDEKFDEEFKDLPDLIWDRMQAVMLRSEDIQDELYTRFIHAVSRYKHRGFQEESEVRAIFSPMTYIDLKEFEVASPEEYVKVKHRQLKRAEYRDGFVPYIALSRGGNGKLPIKRIIVGPHADKHSRKGRLDWYLEMNSFEIETVVSETPLI
jgi:hypothetical protein